MTDAMIKNTTDDKSTISSNRSHHLTITNNFYHETPFNNNNIEWEGATITPSDG